MMQLVNRQEAMDRLGDDAELFAEICGLFCRDVPEMLNQLKSALVSGDTTLAIRSAHSIKSASSSIGAETLSSLARDIEEAGRAGNFQVAHSQLEDLATAIDDVMKELRSAASNC
jgi:HPt (histidine-containing phosphotransfer) domain-containing protein